MTKAPIILLLAPGLLSASTTASTASQDEGGVRCVVHTRDQALATIVGDRVGWFVPERVDRIAVDKLVAGASVFLEAGAARWPLPRATATSMIALTDPQRAAWRAAGRLRVEVHDGTGLVAQFALQVVPARLELPDAAELTIKQRQSGYVPGSSEYLSVRIDDITASQVLLEMRGGRDEEIVRQRSVRPGEHVPFTFGSEHFVLTVKRLVNFLIGDDFGVFAVRRQAAFELDRVQMLLDRLERSTLTFEREGKDYTGAEAAAHLRQKLQAARGADLTAAEFVASVASRSSTTGHPYHVRKADGTRVEAAAWFADEMAAIAEDERRAATRPATRPSAGGGR